MPETTSQPAVETLEEIATRIVDKSFWGIPAEETRQQLKSDIVSALRNKRGNHLVLTEREQQILIDHHNYEAEKAITRLGCRITERYHRDRARAIREGKCNE